VVGSESAMGTPEVTAGSFAKIGNGPLCLSAGTWSDRRIESTCRDYMEELDPG
jgi:hypothetical protein